MRLEVPRLAKGHGALQRLERRPPAAVPLPRQVVVVRVEAEPPQPQIPARLEERSLLGPAEARRAAESALQCALLPLAHLRGRALVR